MDGYAQISLQEMLTSFGDDRTEIREILADYSCPLNPDVERFLKGSAITFAEQAIAPTYLVFASHRDKPVLVGYYTLCMKSIRVLKKSVGSNLRKRLTKFAASDPDTGDFILISPLIAQLGKNYSHEYNRLISGDELLSMAIERVKEAQHLIGGKIVYVECEDTPKLLEFYGSNGFVAFNKRMLERDETEVMRGEYLMQLLRYL